MSKLEDRDGSSDEEELDEESEFNSDAITKYKTSADIANSIQKIIIV
jgi:hypothetical protein